MTTSQDMQNTSGISRAGFTVRTPTTSAARSGPAAAGIRIVTPIAVAFAAGTALNVLLLVVAAMILTNAPYGWVVTTTAVCAVMSLAVVRSIRLVNREGAESTDTAHSAPTIGSER